MTGLLNSALAYAERGYEVLPLTGKAPLTPRGFYDATTNEQTIREWWHKWPGANIGCRPPDPVLIFDIDPRNGGNPAELGAIPSTRTARTGSGGWHLWFGATGIFRSALADAKGIDLKTAKGFVVMPPSVHPVTGKPYRWEISGPVAPLPEHLVSRVVKPPARSRPGQGYSPERRITDAQLAGVIRKMEEAVTERNNTLLWCACRLLERNASFDDLVQLELAAASVGLEDDEIARTIESAAKQVGK